jgi:diguanylate cyclase (GGDEF)-like protein
MIKSLMRQKIPTVLVVDDERIQRVMLAHALLKEGIQVIEAVDGTECLQWCQVQTPDLILMDAIMPRLDGFACCAQLQAMFGEQCPPVLMITSLDDQKSIDRAFEAGATDYITKPILWAVLRRRVQRMIQGHWAMLELQRLVGLDGLTQIANRRRFDECLQREWQRLARDQMPLALLLCDIDFFKAYNDTYGHQAGDDCLRQVAALLQEAAQRPADLAARYGGEEFAVILPNTDQQGAMRVAKAVEQEIHQRAIVHASSSISPCITLSIGAASMIPISHHSPDMLVAAADRALYQAKEAGRDRVMDAYSCSRL